MHSSHGFLTNNVVGLAISNKESYVSKKKDRNNSKFGEVISFHVDLFRLMSIKKQYISNALNKVASPFAIRYPQFNFFSVQNYCFRVPSEKVVWPVCIRKYRVELMA